MVARSSGLGSARVRARGTLKDAVEGGEGCLFLLGGPWSLGDTTAVTAVAAVAAVAVD